MRKSLWILALAFTPALQAWNCDHSKQIDEVLDLSGSDSLEINAVAGDLEVRAGGGNEAAIRGKVCVSDKEMLDEAVVETGGGSRAEITVVLPESSGWSLTGNNYAYMDLEVTVPDDIDVAVKDSSGDAEISGLASVSVQDSSGDLEISDIGGTVEVRDSSGDIEIEDILGDVLIANDSSGDMEIEHVTGSVLIENDSSGSIYVFDVSNDVTVERDSSGSITADGVGGNFTVLNDGSGDISSSDVKGMVDIPEKS